MITLPVPRSAPGTPAEPARPSPTPDLVEHVVDDLDAGLAAVRAVHQALGLDVPWSVHEGRGFAWRIDGLVQRVWSEPEQESGDGTAFLVRAELEVVRDITDAAAALGTINALNGLSAMGAFVVDLQRGTIVHRTGAWVREGSTEGVTRRLLIAIALQAAEATERARILADVSGGEVAVVRHRALAAHPSSGGPMRLDRLATTAADHAPSPWADGGLVSARRALADEAIAGLGVADARSFTMPIAFGEDAAFLLASTLEPHPTLGRGLSVRLILPHAATVDVDGATAAELQRMEVAAGSPADLMGAWVALDDRMQHLAFYPDLAYTGPDDATDLLGGALARARWLAASLG